MKFYNCLLHPRFLSILVLYQMASVPRGKSPVELTQLILIPHLNRAVILGAGLQAKNAIGNQNARITMSEQSIRGFDRVDFGL